MADVKYTCPQCRATLKPATAVPAGRKIKCPRCGHVFVPVDSAAARTEPPRPAPPAAPPPPPPAEEEGLYRLAEPEPRPAADHADPEERKKDIFIPRSTPSKRGVAQAKVIAPSNGLLAAGIVTCVACLGAIAWSLFPMIFSDTPKKPEEVTAAWVSIAVSVLVFLYAGLMINGAVQMQNLESYRWALAGAILALVPGALCCWPVTLLAGAWCLRTLLQPEVRAGFQARPSAED
jgi:DNA-directed RNA polymerase subunit RPC12/RpoP